VYPILQAHVNEPTVFVQDPLAWQLCDFKEHSSMSEHEVPVPEYPALQAQVNDPSVFVQVAVLLHVDAPE